MPLRTCLVVVLWILGVFAANAEVYRCDMTANSRFGWISPELYFSVEPKAGRGEVLDGFTKKFTGGAVAARFTRQEPDALKLEWTIHSIRLTNSNQSVKANYSGVFDKATGRMKVIVHMTGGFDMAPPTGSGTCKLHRKSGQSRNR